MTANKTPIQIEKLRLPEDTPDSFICSAFASYEVQDLQFGLDWLMNLAATALDPSENACLLVARRAPDDFIALPLRVNSRTGHASALTTFYSSNYTPVFHTPAPGPLLHALFRYLIDREKIASFDLSPIAAESPVFALLQNGLSRSGWRGVHTFFCSGNWTHALENANYQAYIATRPSRVRNTVKRRARHFLEHGRGELTLVTGGADLEVAISEFVAIYNCSWKRPEPFPDFIPQLLRLAASRGWLRLGIARHDGLAVAGQIWFVWQGIAYIFKLAYREDFKSLSPGTVLTAYMLEQAIDRDGVRKIDYLSGDDPYKQDWMSERGERHGVSAFNIRTARGNAMLIGRTIKGWLQALLRQQPD